MKIYQDESQNIEYKESWNDKYLEWICGFANAQGGRIFIGVDDAHEVVGVKDSKRLMEDIPNKIVTHLGLTISKSLLSQAISPLLAKEYTTIAQVPQNKN